MDLAFKALAEPRRREILRRVWTDELAATEIADLFTDVTRSAVSQHLGVLREAELIIVLDHGSVIEAGPHAQLLANNSVYAQLVNRQQVGNGLQRSA